MAQVVCPDCRTPLPEDLRCDDCSRAYPKIGSIPILLPANSVFVVDDIQGGGYFRAPRNERRTRWRRRLPSLTSDFAKKPLDEAIANSSGIGLVVGAGEKRPDLLNDRVTWTVTDVSAVFGVDYVADAHRLPFKDSTFDVVLADNVLEHTLAPHVVASELERVCRVGGRLIIRVPFTYPLHSAPYDFFRFSPFGLRCIFRQVDVEQLVPGHGPGGTIAYLATSWIVASVPQRLRSPVYAASRLLFSAMKHLDRPRFDTAGSVLLVGVRRSDALNERAVMMDAAAIVDRAKRAATPADR